MKFLALSLAFLACLCTNAYSQATGSAMQGKIFTENHDPAEASTVILLKYKDSAIVSSAITDKNGRFQFCRAATDSYLFAGKCREVIINRIIWGCILLPRAVRLRLSKLY